MTRRSLVGGLLILALFAPPAAADDNTAVAVNTKDGASLFKLAFDVRRVMAEVIDSGNAAVAYSSCQDCRTVAIAVQLVLVMSEPTDVSPTNLAIAINELCDTCETLAIADQIVFGTGEHLRFTAEGQRQLAEVRRALHDLRQDATLTPSAIAARVDEVTTRLRTLIATELVPVGPPRDGLPDGDPPRSVAPQATVPPFSPGPGSQTERPPGTASPSGSASPTATPTTEHETSPSPTPSVTP